MRAIVEERFLGSKGVERKRIDLDRAMSIEIRPDGTNAVAWEISIEDGKLKIRCLTGGISIEPIVSNALLLSGS